MTETLEEAGQDPRTAFSNLYESMTTVQRFGRLARFDYIAMLGKMKLANLEPSSAFVGGAAGPLAGARLLFSGRTDAKLAHTELDKWLLELDEKLNVGMQVMEDALCNWQKSPTSFRAFRG